MTNQKQMTMEEKIMNAVQYLLDNNDKRGVRQLTLSLARAAEHQYKRMKVMQDEIAALEGQLDVINAIADGKDVTPRYVLERMSNMSVSDSRDFIARYTTS